MTVSEEKSIADADDPVEAVIEDDAAQATRGRYGWLSLTVAALFGLVYAYFLWQAVSLLVQLPTNLAALGLGGDRIPWWLLILGVLIPPIVFGVAAAVGRKQNVGRKAVIFVVGLAIVSGLGLSVIALTYILIFGPVLPATPA